MFIFYGLFIELFGKKKLQFVEKKYLVFIVKIFYICIYFYQLLFQYMFINLGVYFLSCIISFIFVYILKNI